MIAVINYGSGNIHAIRNVLKRLNVSTVVINRKEDFEEPIDKIILPGVGAFDEVMQNLTKSELLPIITEKVLVNKLPTLGICVGMQLMGTSSEEGQLNGLDWIPGKIRKFNPSKIKDLPKLPHMGWNSVKPSKNKSIFKKIDCEKGFYFIHSYYYDVDNVINEAGSTNYGDNFASVIQNGNIIGCQFHPEKSHGNGTQFFKNFLEL